MSMSQKFLFDTSFETENLGDNAVRPVHKPPPPKFGEEDLERARAEGHAFSSLRCFREPMADDSSSQSVLLSPCGDARS